MTTEELTAEFSKVHGKHAMAELIACLHEVNSLWFIRSSAIQWVH